jgi:xylulokinase
MYYLGIDIGSSSIKVSLVEMHSGKCIGLVKQPEKEMSIFAEQKGWAEQSPEDWWIHVCKGIQDLKSIHNISEVDIKGIGIAYQMHGLVVVDRNGKLLRKSIIWCDSRAVEIGNNAYTAIGEDHCDTHLLNSPANFTASKLRWIKENEPDIYAKIAKIMLPGDYVAFRLSGTINTTISGLSEGIFWNFKQDEVSEMLLKQYGINKSLIPDLVETLGEQAFISEKGARESGLLEGTPILYRAGDQTNNALSLNVFQPGEAAVTGGTSGVVYAISNSSTAKETKRINSFAHVNYKKELVKNIGKLLCINGTGIQYRWILENLDVASYDEMNELAKKVKLGSDGLCILPFGNGAERMLYNKNIGSRIVNLDLNRHNKAHICRAALEGIAFSFVYGMEIMKADDVEIKCIRAGNDNIFQSEIFSNTIATMLGKEIELYNTTGAIGAARACTISENGYGAFTSYLEQDHIKTFVPAKDKEAHQLAYRNWKEELELILNKNNDDTTRR